jgi:hypothetical protein
MTSYFVFTGGRRNSRTANGTSSVREGDQPHNETNSRDHTACDTENSAHKPVFALNPALFRRSSRILNGNGLSDLVGTGTRENSAGNRHFLPIVGDKSDNRRVELAAAIFIGSRGDIDDRGWAFHPVLKWSTPPEKISGANQKSSAHEQQKESRIV